MQKIVIIHGMSAHLDECFGLKLKEELLKSGDYQIFEPSFPLHPNITLEGWTEKMDEILPHLDEDTIYVCHSLGTMFILKYLYKRKLSARALICVAGGFPSGEIPKENHYLDPFTPNLDEFSYAINVCPVRYNIFNSADHIWTPRMIADYNSFLAVTPIELDYGGHFGRSSGIKSIPELSPLIKSHTKL